MRFQWNLIMALIFALIVAIFAVINVDPVRVEYIFGTGEWPLILVILGSALMGGIIVGAVGLFRIFILQRKLRVLQRENDELKKKQELITEEKTDIKQLENVESNDTITIEDKSETTNASEEESQKS